MIRPRTAAAAALLALSAAVVGVLGLWPGRPRPTSP